MKNKNKLVVVAPIIAAAVGFSNTVNAIDVDPLDYVAAPAGVNLAILYAGSINEHTNLGADLDANINIARFVAYREFMGITVDPQILIPFGKQEIAGGALEASGFADPILAATFWFVNDDKNQFGITPFLTVPIGSYDNNDSLNLGKNTWEGTIQAGWVHKPTTNLALEVVTDVTFSTDNDDFGPTGERLTKDATFQVQLLASYKLSGETTLGVNLSRQWGGDTEVANVVTDGAEITKASIYAQHWIAPTLQIQGKYSRDLEVDNVPFETQTFQLRLLKVF
jgi:hypothetical protein